MCSWGMPAFTAAISSWRSRFFTSSWEASRYKMKQMLWHWRRKGTHKSQWPHKGLLSLDPFPIPIFWLSTISRPRLWVKPWSHWIFAFVAFALLSQGPAMNGEIVLKHAHMSVKRQVKGEMTHQVWHIFWNCDDLCDHQGYRGANQGPLGNSMGTPMGIAPATRTRPVQYPYPQPHGFFHQNEPKNVEIGQEMRELWLILMNFMKSAITPSVFVRKLRF